MTAEASSQQLLDEAARCIQQAERAAGVVVSRSYRGERDEISRYARQAQEAAEAAKARLLVLGATPPSSSARQDVPLELLDTPATRRLMAALEEAVLAGRAVDLERGWVDEDERPIGFSERYGGDLVQLRTEIQGPKGRD